jgi:spore coat protein U-like protein
MRETSRYCLPLSPNAGQTSAKSNVLARKLVYPALVLGAVLSSAWQAALAGASTSTLGVSLTIVAGCSARTEGAQSASLAAGIAASSVSIKCDNVIPYRVELQPATVAVVPENAASGTERPGINILIVY